MKKQNGITLIALVITIIVLLILAGVSISAITGENGIIEKARQAKEETESAQKKEEEDLQSILDYMDGSVDEDGGCPIRFGEAYGAEVDPGVYYRFVFYENGSAEMSVYYNKQLAGSENIPEGTVEYRGKNIIDLSTGSTIGILSDDGTQMEFDGVILLLEVPTYIPEGGTYYVG